MCSLGRRTMRCRGSGGGFTIRVLFGYVRFVFVALLWSEMWGEGGGGWFYLGGRVIGAWGRVEEVRGFGSCRGGSACDVRSILFFLGPYYFLLMGVFILLRRIYKMFFLRFRFRAYSSSLCVDKYMELVPPLILPVLGTTSDPTWRSFRVGMALFAGGSAILAGP